MAFYDRLKEGRINAGLTQEQLAEKLGIAKSTLSGYENGNREPTVATIAKAIDILKIDANFLYQDEMDALGGNPMQLKYDEMQHIKKYRSLDDYGRETVDIVLDREVERYSIISEQNKHLTELENTDSNTIRYIQYYQHLASAGTGQVVFEDMPVDRIAIPDLPKYRRVSYAISVNGHSMQPLFYDGDMLLIEPTCDIEIGEIGIFIVGNEAFVKKLGDGELISLNKDYDNVPLTEYAKCMGRVVDKLDASTI